MDHSSPDGPMAIESKFTQLLLHYRFLSQALLANSQTMAPERKIFNELENTFKSLFDSNPAKIAKLTACSENDSLLAKSGSDPNNNPFSVWKLAEWVNSVKNLIAKLSPDTENKVNGTSKQIIISKPTANIHHYYVKEVNGPKRKFPVPATSTTSTPKSFDDQSKKRKVDFDKSSSSEIEIESEDDFSPSDLLAETLPEQPSTSAKTENVKSYSLRSDRPRRQSAAIAAAKLRESYEDEEEIDDMDDIILLDSTETKEKPNEVTEDTAGDTEVENLVVNCDPFSLFPDCGSESIPKEPAKQLPQPFSANPLPSLASRIVSPLNGTAPRMYIPFNPSPGSSTSRPMLARPLTSIISRPTITSQLPVPTSIIARAIASGKPMMAPNVTQHSSNITTATGKSLGKVLMINSVPYLICSDKDKLNISTSANTSSSSSQLVNTSPSTPSSSNTQGIRHPVTVKMANVNGLRGSTASLIRVNYDGSYSAAVPSNAKAVSEVITIDSDDEEVAPGQQITEQVQSNITPGNNNTSISGDEAKDKEAATVDKDHCDGKGETEQETEIPPECASKDDETKDKEDVLDDNDQVDNCKNESELDVEISKEQTSKDETKVMEDTTVDSDQVVAKAETGTEPEIPQEGPNKNIVTYDLTDESSRSSVESNNLTDTGDSFIGAADEGDSQSAVPKAKRSRGRPRKHCIHVDAKAEIGPETEISQEGVSKSVITKDLTDESSSSSVKSDNLTDTGDSVVETGDSQSAVPKAKRGRGRPRKHNISVDANAEPETEIPQEGPNKNLVTNDLADESSRSSLASSNLTDTGDSVVEAGDEGDSQSAVPKAKRGRGRPRKYKKSADDSNSEGKGSLEPMAKRPLRSKNEISDGSSTA